MKSGLLQSEKQTFATWPALILSTSHIELAFTDSEEGRVLGSDLHSSRGYPRAQGLGKNYPATPTGISEAED